jgi:peptide methionine sulfoxide reductase msrA/msrB
MTKDIYLAGGCFWGTEHYLKRIRGVVSTETGYANGNIAHPIYREVYTDTTGYAETVHVVYDPDVLGLERLIQIYFSAIDPTSLNKQGEDEGTRYRTGIYYTDPEDLPAIRKIYDRVAGEVKAPLAVEVKPLKNFYRAEEYHQDYLDKNPQGYCHISPALIEFARTANDPSNDAD